MVDIDVGGPQHKEAAFEQLRQLAEHHRDDRELRHAVAATFANAANEGFRRRGDDPALRRLLADALLLDPGQPAVLVVAARLDAALGQVDEAMRKLDLAAQSSPPWRISPRYNRARILLDAARPREALAICRQLVQELPDLGVAWELSARACERAGDGAGALAAWERLLALDPEDEAAKQALGLAPRRGSN
jgi:predicted Zn-dependent protease